MTTKLVRHLITTREPYGYSADEAADDIRAALDQAGVDLVDITLRGVDFEPTPLDITEDRTPEQLAQDGDACLCPSPEVIAYECPVHASAHPGRRPPQ